MRPRKMVAMMKTMRTAKRIMAVLCAAVIASFAFAGSAFADTAVHGADFHGTGAALDAGNVDVLNVDGLEGDTIFLTVFHDKKPIARNLPYTLGEKGTSTEGKATQAGVATLDIAGFNPSDFNGAYTIEARDSRAGGKVLYSGTIYGVYADLPGVDPKDAKLIGTRTVSDAEINRSFDPPETLVDGGQTYKLTGKSTGKGAIHYEYEKYNQAKTVDGVLAFVDGSGNVVAKKTYPGIASGEKLELTYNDKNPQHRIPAVVTGEDGLYRTVFFGNKVVFENPGAVSYKMYCTKVTDIDQALAGYYVAIIKLVDETGAVIASDSVNVTGNFTYTAPTNIYKKETETSIGQPAVVTYTVKDGQDVLHLSAAENVEGERTKTYTIEYTKQDPDQPTAVVTYNLIDGSKRVGESGRKLGTQQVTVDLDNPTATPSATIDANGTTYKLVGEPTEYEYTIRTQQVPSINAYYVPEGYEPPGPYEVTVNYVNYLTDQVVESHAYTSDPNETGALVIETPKTFTSDGVDYIRLDGQEDAIEHSYYSGIAAYTVYYRDKNDTLSSGTVINTIRVVYRDGGASSTTTTTNATTTTDGRTTTTINPVVAADDDTAGGLAADGAATADNDNTPQNMQLNNDRTYNVIDGDGGNGTMTNESGVDSNTERIEDSETPLASGFDKGGTSTAASSLSGMAQWMLPVGIVLIVVIIAAAGVMVIRRRKNDEANEA